MEHEEWLERMIEQYKSDIDPCMNETIDSLVATKERLIQDLDRINRRIEERISWDQLKRRLAIVLEENKNYILKD